MNTKLGKEIWTGISVGTCDLHDERNDNVLILVMYNHCGKLECYFHVCEVCPKSNENDYLRRAEGSGKESGGRSRWRVSCPEVGFSLIRLLCSLKSVSS
jgi:hypothetical protein